MTILFGTEEWLDLFMNRLNADERYKELASDYEGRIIIRCYADPSVHELLAKLGQLCRRPTETMVRCSNGGRVEGGVHLLHEQPRAAVGKAHRFCGAR